MNVLRLSIAAGALAFGGILFAQTAPGTDGAAPQPPAATAPQGPGGPGGPGYGPRDGQGSGERMHRHHHQGQRGGFMKHADENRDGQISRDEVLSAQKRQLAMFERADANSDGTVSRDEMRAAREAMRSEFRKGDGQGCRDGERRGRGAQPAAAPSSQAPAADGKV